ncbi:MAG: Brp/Blh family beta-carotene 15,15'-dioxygenase [Verrucomicrobia bacterium]|nr:Brp/Blh family beta-carotene 15,15'-dioxygenase [Verrucomicrobiota bacterium]
MPFLLRHTVPWFLALSLGLFTFAFPRLASESAPWFFLSSALILGVPHGACDLWIPGWLRHRPSGLSFLFIFFVAYLSLSALYLLLWKAFPFPSTIFFLVLTAWHWGSADASLEFFPGPRWLAFSVGRGSLVMLAPFAFHLSETWTVLLQMAPTAGPAPASLPFLIAVPFSVFLILLARPSPKNWIETILLLLLFYFTPPLLSVGTYFIAFHAWRHLLRLASIRDQLSPTHPTRRWILSLARLLLLSIPLTIASLAFLRWIPPFLSQSMPSGQNWVGPYLVLLAVLTLPHALLVGWVDKQALNSKL